MMTLSRQLFLSSIAVLIFLFLGMTVFVMRNAQTFFSQQLASHSQDTATALGLTLTTTLKQKDKILAGRIVDTVWDRGDFSYIKVETAKGKTLVEQKAVIKIRNVPEWFVKLVPIETQPAEALIMDGWQQFGKVIVVSDPSFAYRQIWFTFIESLQWFFITMALAVILGAIMLHIILKPLKAVIHQAVVICNGEFLIQSTLPTTPDLRKVVEAMNNMSSRLKVLFEEQSATSAGLREQIYKDPVTKLANRRYFDLQIDYLLNDQEHSVEGVLLLIEIHDFKKINQQFGYQSGDKLLVQVSQAIVEVCHQVDNAIVTHMRGASFIIILPGKTRGMGESIADAICRKFRQFKQIEACFVTNIGHIGVATFKPGNTQKDLLSRADMALRVAQSQGQNTWYSEELKPHEVHTQTEWIATFENVLKNNALVLFFQKIQFLEKKQAFFEKHYEVFTRIRIEENNLILASVFVPIAEQLNLMLSLDERVIEQVVDRIRQNTEKVTYFVNVSPSLLEDTEALQRVVKVYLLLADQASQLVIEFSEQAVVRRLDQARAFFREIAQLGGSVSIDHYGNSFSSFSYLYNLKVNYLKIDGGFIRNVHINEENQFFIRSLVEIAHSLDIVVLAGLVETEQEYHALKLLNVDGIQGNFISKPSDILN